MDYRRINYIDISSCMLFEATGDSEFDSGVTSSAITNGLENSSYDVEDIQMHAPASLAEDDAFSCSCEDNLGSDDFDDPSVNYKAGCEEHEDEQVRLVVDEYDHHRHGYPDDEDEDEDAVDQVRKAGGGANNNVIRKKINIYQPEPPGGGGGGAVEVIMNMMELAEAGRPKKSKVCRKPEFINQRDRDTDRLFWEACLSS